MEKSLTYDHAWPSLINNISFKFTQFKLIILYNNFILYTYIIIIIYITVCIRLKTKQWKHENNEIIWTF